MYEEAPLEGNLNQAVRGIDGQGREILDYIPGDAYSGSTDPVPDHVLDEEHLVDAARPLRRYHDIVLFGLAARARRLQLFRDGYGLEERSQLLPVMRLRIVSNAR